MGPVFGITLATDTKLNVYIYVAACETLKLCYTKSSHDALFDEFN